MTASNNQAFATKLLYKTDPKLPKVILKELVNATKDLDYMKSITYDDADPNYRSSQQYWLPWDHWIAGIMHNIFISANNDYFHYDLDHFQSGIQVTKYDVGQQYDWHQDQGEELQDNDGKIERKLSMSFLLTDDYTGGELEIYDISQSRIVNIPLKAGEVALFPSWLPHRCRPVKTGTRICLVAWMNGPVFK